MQSNFEVGQLCTGLSLSVFEFYQRNFGHLNQPLLMKAVTRLLLKLMNALPPQITSATNEPYLLLAKRFAKPMWTNLACPRSIATSCWCIMADISNAENLGNLVEITLQNLSPIHPTFYE